MEIKPDPRKGKEQYQSFIRKKTTKSVKQQKRITPQPKIFENTNIADIKSIIIEHQKTLHKLTKTIRQAKKVRYNSSLYSDTKTSENEKYINVKITKPEHAFKGYASTYNAHTLNFFNPELQLKDTESAIKSNLIELLTQLKGFQFATTLLLLFIKIGEDKTKYGNFCSISKAEIIITINLHYSYNKLIIIFRKMSSLNY